MKIKAGVGWGDIYWTVKPFKGLNPVLGKEPEITDFLPKDVMCVLQCPGVQLQNWCWRVNRDVSKILIQKHTAIGKDHFSFPFPRKGHPMALMGKQIQDKLFPRILESQMSGIISKMAVMQFFLFVFVFSFHSYVSLPYPSMCNC